MRAPRRSQRGRTRHLTYSVHRDATMLLALLLPQAGSSAVGLSFATLSVAICSSSARAALRASPLCVPGSRRAPPSCSQLA